MAELLTDAEESEIEQARAENGSRSSLQKRIDRMTGEKYKLRQENEELRKENRELLDLVNRYEVILERYKTALRRKRCPKA